MSKIKLFSALVLGASRVFFSSRGAFAQSERGTIEGAVRDTSGAVVVGAKMTATETVSTSITTAAGEYTIPDQPVGTYALQVTIMGFRPELISGLSLHAGSTLRADASLQVGAVQERAEVQANAPTLNTENAVVSTSVTNRQVDELPLVVAGSMRSTFDLANLTSGAKNVGGQTSFVLGGG